MPDLRQIVVLVDIHAELDLLDPARRILFLLFLLGQIVAELPKIHDPATGGCAPGATSMRSRPIERACRRASSMRITPICWLVTPLITRTSRARMRSLTRMSLKFISTS